MIGLLETYNTWIDMVIRFRFTQVSCWKIFSFMYFFSNYLWIVQNLFYEFKQLKWIYSPSIIRPVVNCRFLFKFLFLISNKVFSIQYMHYEQQLPHSKQQLQRAGGQKRYLRQHKCHRYWSSGFYLS